VLNYIKFSSAFNSTSLSLSSLLHIYFLPSYLSLPSFSPTITLTSQLYPLSCLLHLSSLLPRTPGSITPCPAGTLSALTGQTSYSTCTDCPRTYYCPFPGTVTGLECPAHYYCPQGELWTFHSDSSLFVINFSLLARFSIILSFLLPSYSSLQPS
jgi:hypothetical protein